MPLPTDRAVRQIAYFVPDAIAAATTHSALFGSGPYYVAEHIPLSLCRHRGQVAELDHTSAYGQWGEVMIEFVQQNNEGPSVFRDMYPDGGEGIHHVALIVDDLRASMKAFEADGFETGLYAEVGGPDTAFAMLDCRKTLGHFVELYEPSETLLGIYGMIRAAAQGWNGGDPIRSFAIPR